MRMLCINFYISIAWTSWTSIWFVFWIRISRGHYQIKLAGDLLLVYIFSTTHTLINYNHYLHFQRGQPIDLLYLPRGGFHIERGINVGEQGHLQRAEHRRLKIEALVFLLLEYSQHPLPCKSLFTVSKTKLYNYYTSSLLHTKELKLREFQISNQ